MTLTMMTMMTMMTRPSSKTSQLQPAVVSLATSPPSVLSLQVLLLDNLVEQVFTANFIAKLRVHGFPIFCYFSLRERTVELAQ